MPAIGLHVIGAGIFAALAFVLWAPLGIVAGVLLLNAARLSAFPSVAVRTDHSGVQ
ncbi:MAG: hypothetical protein JWP31_1132, partial [Aeromicrobium sp.]|nr:hypothetical protein [Aeromicrobium sp.]